MVSEYVEGMLEGKRKDLKVTEGIISLLRNDTNEM